MKASSEGSSCGQLHKELQCDAIEQIGLGLRQSMTSPLGKVRASSWDETDIFLGEIAWGKQVVIGANDQRGHPDAVEFRATIERQDGIESTRLNLRPAQIATVPRFFGGQFLMMFVDPIRGVQEQRAELRVSLPTQLLVEAL